MKRLRKIVGLALLLAVLLALGGLLFLDQIGRWAVEKGGESAMGVETSLDHLSLKLFRGEGRLEGLGVGNPSGFETPHFMRLSEGSAALDMGTLLSDTVVMRSIELQGLDVNLERRDEGANYEVILAHMKRNEEGGTGGEGKKFLVREVVVRDVQVHADVALAGQKVTRVDLRIDEVRLEDVGSDTDSGVIMSQLMGTIVKAVLVAIVEQGATVLPPLVVKGLGAGLKGVGKLTFKVTVKVGGKVVNVMGGAAKAAGGAVKDAIKGIGGILDGEEEEEDK